MIAFMEFINTFLSGTLVPFILIASGLYIGARLRFFHILKPLKVIRGLKNDKSDGISSAKAVTLALAGTLGVGNIVGVSSAIALGGFGSVFWMWISALVAMILKYAEIALAMRHRRHGANGTRGGAMYYIIDLFHSLGLDRLGKILASVFSVLFLLTSLTMGSMLQSNAVSEALEGIVGVPPLAVGLLLAALTLLAAKKGADGIANVTNYLVPIMSFGYVAMSVAVIIIDRDGIAGALLAIIKGAFSPAAATGGVGGFVFTRALRFGVMRGLVSNEAGCGTAPTAHALADCNSPARQGLWGIFEVFVDTIVLCTMTALVVILEYDTALAYNGNYMMITASAFGAALGGFAQYFLCAAVVCFGFATVVCWWHYGMSSVEFLSKKTSTRTMFGIVYCACVVIGALTSSEMAWQLSDLAMGAMTVINLAVIVMMSGELKAETHSLG